MQKPKRTAGEGGTRGKSASTVRAAARKAAVARKPSSAKSAPAGKAAGTRKTPASKAAATKAAATKAAGTKAAASKAAGTKAAAGKAPAKGRAAPTRGSRGKLVKPRRTRSQATRQEIIDAAIDCFVEIGYVRTTTTEIAQMSGYTRGAVQYYFPTTHHVLKASIDYLTKQWLDTYMTAAGNAPPGTDYIDFAVDTLWRFVNDKLFVAWQELVHASRTDKDLRKIIMPAAARFEQLRRQMGQANFPDFHEASVTKFQRNRDTLRFVVEGITSTIITYDRDERIQAQLDWLKEWFHASWAQELASMNGAR